tara:strand:- start:404 stop:523 length:120 start_codon:yes stop_codon:yes gene_type:complete
VTRLAAGYRQAELGRSACVLGRRRLFTDRDVEEFGYKLA